MRHFILELVFFCLTIAVAIIFIVPAIILKIVYDNANKNPDLVKNLATLFVAIIYACYFVLIIGLLQ